MYKLVQIAVTEQVCSVLKRDADRGDDCGRCRFSDLNSNNVCHDIIVVCSEMYSGPMCFMKIS